MPDFEREGRIVVAMSYDPVPVLERFATSRGITYPLLSDEGSHVIEAMGLIHNQLMDQLGVYAVRDDLDRYLRVAYPCTFVLDRSGIVVDKVFEEHHLVRRSPDWYLADSLDGAAVARGGIGSVGVSISTPTAAYHPTQKLPLRIELEIAPGYHVYATPAPEGIRSFGVEIDFGPEATVNQTLPDPNGRIHDDLGDEYPVYEGSVAWTASLMTPTNIGELPISARFRFQVCSDVTCEPPKELELILALRGSDYVEADEG